MIAIERRLHFNILTLYTYEQHAYCTYVDTYVVYTGHAEAVTEVLYISYKQ